MGKIYKVVLLGKEIIIKRNAKGQFIIPKELKFFSPGLKPACEPILLCMKPLDGTYVHNALKHGVAGLNIEECRIKVKGTRQLTIPEYPKHETNIYGDGLPTSSSLGGVTNLGRWPANVILQHHPNCKQVGTKKTKGREGGYKYKDKEYDVKGFLPKVKPQAPSNYGGETLEDWSCHDDCPVKMLDEQSGDRKGWASQKHSNFNPYGGNALAKSETTRVGFHEGYDDTGGASRFFYTAKASQAERGKYNTHPTVKPVKILEYLCKLTRTPTGGIVLDPFMGSGSTAIACINTGRPFIGIELDRDYLAIAIKRIEQAQEQAQRKRPKPVTKTGKKKKLKAVRKKRKLFTFFP